MENGERGFENEYSDKRFRQKIAAYARSAGKEVVEKALWLYYSAQHPKTPGWAKSVIYGALGYFIFPLDAIPDLTPVAGYADDLGVLVAALATVAIYVNDEVRASAASKMKAWFGD
ncbi:MAG: YkvA family protein [Propionivibrio sp.]